VIESIGLNEYHTAAVPAPRKGILPSDNPDIGVALKGAPLAVIALTFYKLSHKYKNLTFRSDRTTRDEAKGP